MYDFHDPELLRRIPLSSQVILEVGGGGGDLAAAYRRLNPRALIFGLVAHDTLTPLHEGAYDRLAVGDVEAAPLPFDDVEGRVDCIIYNECLERMRDPLAVLRRHVACLSLDGMMLIKVANPDHWRLTERMLRGPQADWPGVPQAPPSPLFASDRLRDALLELGLTLCDVTSEDSRDQNAVAFINAVSPALAALGVDASAYARRSLPSHFIWRIRKT